MIEDLLRGFAVIVFTLFTLYVGVMSGGWLLGTLAPESSWVGLLGATLFPVSIAATGTIVQGLSIVMLPFLFLRWVFSSKKPEGDEEEGVPMREALLERLMSRGVIVVAMSTFVVVFGVGGLVAAWSGGTPILWGGFVSGAAGAAWCVVLVVLVRVGWFALPD